MKQGKNKVKNDKNKKKISPRQTAALLGAVLLVLLYGAALAAAILDSSVSGGLFRACLSATIAVPLLIWIYVWLYGKFTGRPTITDPPGQDPSHGQERSGRTAAPKAPDPQAAAKDSRSAESHPRD